MKFFSKKKLAAAVLSTSLFLVSPQVDASNFFEEVPANDWSYSAVNELIGTGNVPGYNQKIPQGRILSRLEMAMIVDEAMKNQSAFNSQQRNMLNRLNQEYFYDIKKVQLLSKIDRLDEDTLDNLDKPQRDSGRTLFTTEETDKLKALANRFEINGFAQIRHDHTIESAWTPEPTLGGDGVYHYNAPDGKTRSTPSTYTKIDLTAKYKINDKWKAGANFILRGNTDEVDDWTWSGGENVSTVPSPWVWVEGNVGGGRGVDVKFGRWNEWTPMGWGYDMDSDVTGGQIAFGNPKFRTTLTAVKVDLWDNYMSSNYLQNVRGYETDDDTPFVGVRFDWQPSEKTDVHFGVHGMGAMTSRYQDDKRKNHVLYYWAHAGYKIDDNWKIHGGIINSNAKMIDHPWGEDGPNPTTSPGYWFNVWYKNIDLQQPGTYDIWATYRKEPGKSWVTVTDWWPKNAEGFRLGADYVVAKNMFFTTWADKIKEIDTKAKHTRYRFQMQFMFE